MLENPTVLPKIVHESSAKSTEYVTPESVDHLCERTTPYAKTWKEHADKIWLQEHPTGKKVYEDDISMMDVDKKATILAQKDAELDAEEKAFVDAR